MLLRGRLKHIRRMVVMHILELILRSKPVVRVPDDFDSLFSALMRPQERGAYIGCCCYSKHLLEDLKLAMAEQVPVRFVRVLCLLKPKVFSWGRLFLRLLEGITHAAVNIRLELILGRSIPPPQQSCYADSWISSEQMCPSLEAHRGTNDRYSV